jgi:hypothetical protein
MEGYDVITSDEFRLGHVTRVEDDHLIVEEHDRHKRQFAIPLAFAGTDDAERVVTLTVSKELVEAGPRVQDGRFDRQAVAEYYGLADGPVELDPDDPAWSAEQENLRLGLEPEAEHRARMLQHKTGSSGGGRQIIPSDSHE